ASSPICNSTATIRLTGMHRVSMFGRLETSADARIPTAIRVQAETPLHNTRTAILLHWIAALLIACNFVLGLSMVDLPFGPQKFRWYGWHKWTGITVFLGRLLRLLWRSAYPPPPAVAMPDWQRKAARATHLLLYGLMLVIPLSGWLYSSATGVSVVYLGLVPLPDLVSKDKALAEVLKAVHVTLNFTLLALVFVHTGAAF